MPESDAPHWSSFDHCQQSRPLMRHLRIPTTNQPLVSPESELMWWLNQKPAAKELLQKPALRAWAPSATCNSHVSTGIAHRW
eukprot:CAMPEP_0175281446 /NCGR_PEP_ID=MMETSP0093-20121207/51108_1 /TAXON_ID=311494 /ORGANISM="Alexandrium monilatum, Strain CCMP3105" /LENGTH=81 /DNA_ID=CAMNT_0016576593 /DNA_START=25 /DNA_END=267 /DNA_ORIENTATION=-